MSAEPIRLLVSDIDGTLVRRDKSLSDGVAAAVQRVLNAGIPVSLISACAPDSATEGPNSNSVRSSL